MDRSTGGDGGTANKAGECDGGRGKDRKGRTCGRENENNAVGREDTGTHTHTYIYIYIYICMYI
jgi:hypothetical protein